MTKLDNQYDELSHMVQLLHQQFKQKFKQLEHILLSLIIQGDSIALIGPNNMESNIDWSLSSDSSDDQSDNTPLKPYHVYPTETLSCSLSLDPIFNNNW